MACQNEVTNSPRGGICEEDSHGVQGLPDEGQPHRVGHRIRHGRRIRRAGEFVRRHDHQPVVGAIFGQPSFSSLTIGLWANSTLYYGAFLTEVITFVGIAASVFFFIVKPYNAYKARTEVEEAPPPPPEDDESVILLREIRDSLNK